ncbi:hypothetical protein GGTG_03789 [Gaeumannomyces tritici R3-111a-1]|uniref:Uncharacterized protein n=1 Tax=Gaeumannomyces tritici (strain R3-111a-1) TaxID=644352 RepID=J3NR84_GAET3|nr:hypothetical protein GGTG_03789 [Gaeumannomyces tritici R3-111a-1]EJT78690.1 hypothetical protein GGTG_03789 [Gaeumannomyces tritici R3-111a-1]
MVIPPVDAESERDVAPASLDWAAVVVPQGPLGVAHVAVPVDQDNGLPLGAVEPGREAHELVLGGGLVVHDRGGLGLGRHGRQRALLGRRRRQP